MNHHYSTQTPTRLITMNSLHAEKINSTNHVRFPFKTLASCGRNQTLLVGVSSLVIPISYAVISSRNNALYVNGVLYLIPTGSPSAVELTETLNTLMVPQGVSVTYDDTKGRFTFTSTSSSTITIGASSTAQLLLGLPLGVNISGTTIQSGGVCDLAGPRVLHLHSNLNVMCMDSLTLDINNILCVIPVNVSNMSMLSYRGDELYQLTDTSIKTLEFYFTDGIGNILDFQGGNWTLTLSVSVIQTPDSTVPKNILSRYKEQDDGVSSQTQKTDKKDRTRTFKNRETNARARKEDPTRRRQKRKDGRQSS